MVAEIVEEAMNERCCSMSTTTIGNILLLKYPI